jgi:hypothetical protein
MREMIYENYNLEKSKSKIERRAVDMKTDKKSNEKKTQEPFRFTKRHGSTTFHVAVYSNLNAKETAQDKIARLIKNDSSLCEYGDVKIRKAGNE